jgi:hypothetical protein
VTDYARLLAALHDAGVRCTVVGGAAATAHGSVRLTLDLDVVYDRSPDDIDRLVAALAPQRPYLRGAPPGLPFVFGAETIRRGLNFMLTTDVGWIDLLGEIAGGGTFEQLMAHTVRMRLFERPFAVLSLPQLIHVKR